MIEDQNQHPKADREEQHKISAKRQPINHAKWQLTNSAERQPSNPTLRQHTCPAESQAQPDKQPSPVTIPAPPQPAHETKTKSE